MGGGGRVQHAMISLLPLPQCTNIELAEVADVTQDHGCLQYNAHPQQYPHRIHINGRLYEHLRTASFVLCMTGHASIHVALVL